MLRHDVYDRFDRDLKKLGKRDEVNDSFYEATHNL